ncbi:MAG: hypothetical protein HY365_02740 [Candidatus Aenigmarchaeota archaeon]|nr:hypothetical protein [Candidatus Aenigmarchaeota archaeon]
MAQEDVHPIVIGDTSWFVDHGRNDLGAISKLARVRSRINSHDEDVKLLVPWRISQEYGTLHERSACDSYGAPLTVSHYARVMQAHLTNKEPAHDMMAAWVLWTENSRKADRGIRLSHADQSVVAHAIEEARNGKECYILSGDEDIIGPSKALQEMFPNSHVPGEFAITLKDATVHSLTADGSPHAPIVLLPEALGILYGIPGSSQTDYYLLCAKVPYGGKTQEVGVSVHPMGKSFTFEDASVKRYPVLVMDIEDYDGTGNITESMKVKIASRYRHMDAYVQRRFRTFGVMEIARSSKHGLFEPVEYSRHLAMRRKVIYMEEKTLSVPWFLISSGYMERNAPETGRALADFYGRHFGEMRTALRAEARA